MIKPDKSVLIPISIILFILLFVAIQVPNITKSNLASIQLNQAFSIPNAHPAEIKEEIVSVNDLSPSLETLQLALTSLESGESAYPSKVFYNRCSKHFSRKEYNRALVWCEIAIDHNSDVIADPFIQTGRIYFVLDKRLLEIEAYEKALEIDSSNQFVYYHLGKAYESQKAYADAIRMYQLALSSSSLKRFGDSNFYQRLAIATNLSGDQDKSDVIALYEKAMDLNDYFGGTESFENSQTQLNIIFNLVDDK